MSSIDNTATHLPLTETFGPTFQGEGPHTGRFAHFIRLGHCNLHCEFCDTGETWDATRYDLSATITETPVAAILDRVAGARLVILTGGEPLMHQRRAAFSDLLAQLDAPVHVETNGTIAPAAATAAMVDHFTVSPKHATTADPEKLRLKPAPLTAFAALARSAATPPGPLDTQHRPGVCFKFVCRDETEVEAAAACVEHFELPTESVWIMPEGTTAAAVTAAGRAIAPAALRYGFNYSTRLHTLLWDNEKGR